MNHVLKIVGIGRHLHVLPVRSWAFHRPVVQEGLL
jgi:hypothetical protein